MNPFATISSAWPKIEPWSTQIQALPTSASAFAKFGTFADESDAQATEAALLAAEAMASELGGPAATKRKIASNGAYLTGSAAPAEIYAHLIWWANQIENVSTTVTQTLSTIMSTSPTADHVRSLLAGSGGLAPTLNDVIQRGKNLSAKVSDLCDRLTPQVVAIASTKMVGEAQQWLGGYESQRAALMEQAAQAYKAWKIKPMPQGDDPPTVAQAEANPSGRRWPWSGDEAQEKAAYSSVVDQITSGDQTKAAKEDLIAALTGLDSKGTQALAALVNVGGGIGSILTTLEGVQSRIASVAESANDDQLTDASWLGGAVDTSALSDLASEANSFAINALVEN